MKPSTMARACEAAGLAVDARLTNSEGATVGSNRDVRVYGNSHGFLEGFSSTSHSLSCVLLAQQGDDMQRDYWFSSARDATELQPLAKRSVARPASARSRALAVGKLTHAQGAGALFAGNGAWLLRRTSPPPIRGGAQYRKSSFLLDAAGQQVLPSFMQFEERPHILRGLASAPFDSEGVATRDRSLVKDGVLQGYVLGSYSARKLGLKTTGNAGGLHNLLVSASPESSLSFEALLKQMGTGLLVTELMGQGVNAVTGDYSRGASGFWVENGALAYPVHEITIAGNLKQMYRDIVALGTDVDLARDDSDRVGVAVGADDRRRVARSVRASRAPTASTAGADARSSAAPPLQRARYSFRRAGLSRSVRSTQSRQRLLKALAEPVD